MAEEEKNTCICPSCGTKYRVPVKFAGKVVSCKKCTASFSITFEDRQDAASSTPEASQDEARPVSGNDPVTAEQTAQQEEAVPAGQGPLNETESAEAGSGEETPEGDAPETDEEDLFKLTVSQDRLCASLALRNGSGGKASLEKVKAALAEKGIVFGIVEDARIEEFLRNGPVSDGSFAVARGIAPVSAQDAAVKYHFETNPFKVGAHKGGGAIDWKDRGEIPQVKAGAVIAEKILGDPGKEGTDVFGETIAQPKAKDVKFRCGKGAEKSEDGTQVRAKLDGQPGVSPDGKLFVLPKLEIPGDVCLETGHVDFEGDIEVRGSVQDGFRVTGGKLSAKEILKAEIDVTGDVVVLGGVIGGRIKSGGNVKARYVHGAVIEAMGDVIIDREVMGSTIEAGRSFQAKTGKIFSSRVCAKKGIEATEIGSAASKPCSLAVGIDERTVKEIEAIRVRIDAGKPERDKYQRQLDALKQEAERLEQEIGSLAQLQDRGTLKRRAIMEKLKAFESANQRDQVAKAKALLEELDNKIQGAEKRLESVFARQDEVAEKAGQLAAAIKEAEQTITALEEDIEALREWSEKDKAIPVVKVHGSIFIGTVIRGHLASERLRETYSRVVVAEKRVPTEDDAPKWTFDITPLR